VFKGYQGHGRLAHALNTAVRFRLQLIEGISFVGYLCLCLLHCLCEPDPREPTLDSLHTNVANLSLLPHFYHSQITSRDR
jgi:hypothetical protein